MTDTATADAPETVTIRLSRPLTTHKGKLSELALKRPTLGALARHGSPYTTTETLSRETGDVSLKVDFDYKVVLALLAEMAADSGADALILEDITGPDVNRVTNFIFEALRGLA